MKTYLYRASNLKSTITFLALVSKRKSISGTRQNRRFLRFFIIIIIINQYFFIWVFSEGTDTFATSLIPLHTNFPEICAFKIGSSRTVWTKMRSLRAH